MDEWAAKAMAAVAREREREREPYLRMWTRAQSKVSASKQVAVGGLVVLHDRDVVETPRGSRPPEAAAPRRPT